MSRARSSALSGWAKVPNTLLRDPKLPALTKVVGALLLSYAWDDPEARPSQKTLAEDAGCSLASIKRALTELVAIGFVEIGRRPGVRRFNVYRIRRSDSSPVSHQKGSDSAPVSSSDSSPMSHHDRSPMRSLNTKTHKTKTQSTKTPTPVSLHQQLPPPPPKPPGTAAAVKLEEPKNNDREVPLSDEQREMVEHLAYEARCGAKALRKLVRTHDRRIVWGWILAKRHVLEYREPAIEPIAVTIASIKKDIEPPWRELVASSMWDDEAQRAFLAELMGATATGLDPRILENGLEPEIAQSLTARLTAPHTERHVSAESDSAPAPTKPPTPRRDIRAEFFALDEAQRELRLADAAKHVRRADRAQARHDYGREGSQTWHQLVEKRAIEDFAVSAVAIAS